MEAEFFWTSTIPLAIRTLKNVFSAFYFVYILTWKFVEVSPEIFYDFYCELILFLKMQLLAKIKSDVYNGIVHTIHFSTAKSATALNKKV